MKKVPERPPIVAVLGHVDHGKTTLLDAIRKTRIQVKETGGITQSIGASVVTTKEGKNITFIDTPGHAAFTKMRSSGVNAADIAILVVAADDGVKPQTTEAIQHIQDSKIPFIVAITKTDLKTASVDKILNQLEKEDMVFEESGGDTLYVEVSGKTSKGLDDLLETVILVAEVNEIKGDKNASLEAVVIETQKSKGGSLVSVVVKNGKLQKGQDIFVGDITCRVKGMFDYLGKSQSEVFPGEPTQILGFCDLPPVGSVVTDSKNRKQGVVIGPRRRNIKKVDEDEIPVVIKTGSAGTMEAVLENLHPKVVVIDSGVGNVNESDIVMAKSANAKIFAFEVKVSSEVRKLANTEDVIVEDYDLIYKLLERMEELVEEKVVKIVARASIVAEFPYNNKKVAGCSILEGEIKRGERLILVRDDKDIGEVRIITLKKGKQEVSKVGQGEECGIIFSPQLDFAIGDMLLSVRK